MEFYIKQGSTLPSLVMELINDGRNDYKKFHLLIQNANLYFSMWEIDTNVKKIGKRPATCKLKEDACPDCPDEYYVVYNWNEKDTLKKGRYKGEFTIEFLDDTGTLICPIREELTINVI